MRPAVPCVKGVIPHHEGIVRSSGRDRPYRGETPLPDGTGMLQGTSDGSWTMALQ
jgi:hypothetical protein